MSKLANFDQVHSPGAFVGYRRAFAAHQFQSWHAAEHLKKVGQVGRVPFFIGFGRCRSWPTSTKFIRLAHSWGTVEPSRPTNSNPGMPPNITKKVGQVGRVPFFIGFGRCRSWPTWQTSQTFIEAKACLRCHRVRSSRPGQCRNG